MLKSFCFLNTEQEPGHLFYDQNSVIHAAGADVECTGKKYVFDDVFGVNYDQERVFERFRPTLFKAFSERRSAYFLAYGPNGAGKTYTMTGGPRRFRDRGLIPRTLSLLFTESPLRSATISASFFEVYKDQVIDLLDERRTPVNLEEQDKGVVIDIKEVELQGESHGYPSMVFLIDS